MDCDRPRRWRTSRLIYDGSKFQLAAPEPNPKRGGVLRVGILNRLPHFDFQQSGTIGSLGTQGCMFDNLIRHDPRDSGKTLIPDLAHSWEIAKDGTTYTFFLRKGVQFHDGAELTADDVKATFDRIAKPPAGRQHPAQHPVQGGQRDRHARQVHRAVQAVRAASGQLHHGGDRQRLERHRAQDRRWRRTTTICARWSNIPGTGPFKSVRRVENEVWVMEKNKDYWNKGLPYLDGIEFYNLHPVLARTWRGDPVQPGGLCAHRRSGDRAQGQGARRGCPRPRSTRA